MDSSQIDDQKQSYLEGTMDPTQVREFEEKMKQDPNLANEIKDLKKIVLGLETLSYESFKNEVHSWEEEYQSKPEIIPMNRYMAIAAGLLLLLIPTITLWYNSQSQDAGNLYALYYSPYQDVILERGGDTEEDQALIEAMEAYNSQDYRGAMAGLSQYLERNTEDYRGFLYLGICQLELDQYINAIGSFKIAENDPYFRQQAQWYRAMTYLKGDQKQQLIEMLDLLINERPKHYQSAKAQELLDIFKPS